MKNLDAITQANQLRPNTLPDELKAQWLIQLDSEIAQMKGETPQPNLFPAEQDLMMDPEYDYIYPLYLTAQIDYYNMEYDLYNNDIAKFNEAYKEAKAWYRRNHPSPNGNWRCW